VGALGFTGWSRFQDAANVGTGFGSISREAGVYCLRATQVGEKDMAKLAENYKQSPLYAAFQMMHKGSETFFGDGCKLGPGWGWTWYANYADKRLGRLRNIPLDEQGRLGCPILYIGCSKSLRKRMGELMDLEHTANHLVWTLLSGDWGLEIAVRATQDYKAEERALKEAYRAAHNGKLPPLMKQ
jgi:hypothetical protein